MARSFPAGGAHVNCTCLSPATAIRQNLAAAALADRKEHGPLAAGAKMTGRRPRSDAACHHRRSAGRGGGQACSRERAHPRSEATPPGITGEPRLINVPAPVNVLHINPETRRCAVIHSRSRKRYSRTGSPSGSVKCLAMGLDWEHLFFFFHNNHEASNSLQICRVACIYTSLISVIHRRISLVSCLQSRSASQAVLRRCGSRRYFRSGTGWFGDSWRPDGVVHRKVAGVSFRPSTVVLFESVVEPAFWSAVTQAGPAARFIGDVVLEVRLGGGPTAARPGACSVPDLG